MTWKVVLAVKTSAAARTSVYFSITGVAAAAVDRVEVAPDGGPGVLAVLHEIGRRVDGVQRHAGAGDDIGHVLLVQGDVLASAKPAHVTADEVLPRVAERGVRRGDVPLHVLSEIALVHRRPARIDDVDEHQRVVVGQVDEDVVR